MKTAVARLAVLTVFCLVVSFCAVGSPLQDLTQRAIGDGTYLNEHAYLRGVNLYTLEQQRDSAAGDIKEDAQASFDYLADQGFDVVRLAVSWQQIIPIPAGQSPADSIEGSADDRYLDVITDEVTRAARAGLRTIIDLHNDCTYPWEGHVKVAGALTCGDGISTTDIAHVWSILADRFKNDDRVAAFDLFNEPKLTIGVAEYKSDVQAAIDAIRSTGDRHVIWVDSMVGGDAAVFSEFAKNGPWAEDPVNALEYSQHFYLGSGEGNELLHRLTSFGTWCSRWGVRCSVGEVGWKTATTTSDANVFERFYDLADSFNMDVTYFAATSRSPVGGYYAFGSSGGTVIDSSGPQAAIIEKHLSLRQ